MHTFVRFPDCTLLTNIADDMFERIGNSLLNFWKDLPLVHNIVNCESRALENVHLFVVLAIFDRLKSTFFVILKHKYFN